VKNMNRYREEASNMCTCYHDTSQCENSDREQNGQCWD
jgi:hypothetical protein